MSEGLRPVNPNTGEPLETIACTPLDKIPEIVSRAAASRKSWSRTKFEDRADLIRKVQSRFHEMADQFARSIHDEMGKPLSQAAGEVDHYTAALSEEIDFMRQALEPEDREFKGGVTRIHYVPLGTSLIISPWNFPFGMPLTLLIPSLLAGNTTVFKPSEIVTHTGLLLATVFDDILPAGVFQTVTGDGEQGKALVDSDFDLIAFVGSRGVGKTIMESAGRRACRVLLEMGGKDPMIVAHDADLDQAAKHAVGASLRNSGQVCCSVERIYVDKTVVDEFVRKVKSRVEKVVVGEDLESKLCIGPMSSEKQMSLVLDQIEDAIRKGATLQHGGKRLDRPGFYLQPTVLTDLNDDMKIMYDETFGPAICIQAVDSIDEAIDRANDSRYGLTATLWTGDEALGRERALELEAGLVGVNGSFSGGASGVPWAGAKESGFGHTGGMSGMRSFLQPRSVTLRGPQARENS